LKAHDAEDEEHTDVAAPSEERPVTARKDSRKFPGGFGIDDVDDLSPDKQTFEDSMFANSTRDEQNKRILSLDPTTLPPLPPPAVDSSLLYGQSQSTGTESDARFDIRWMSGRCRGI